MEHQESKRLMIAFDPSYVRKAGKHTPGIGYYWSGVAGAAKLGIEIAGMAAVDLNTRTAYHLEAVQSPAHTPAGDTLVRNYANLLADRKEQLLSISKDIVADEYFSKYGFVSELTTNGFDVIRRLRDDADLLYLYTGVQKGGRGRPTIYSVKVCEAELAYADEFLRKPFNILDLMSRIRLQLAN